MADYIIDPTATDAELLQQDAFDYLQTRWPDWVPNDNKLEAWVIGACARMVAEARDLASDVPPAIFRYYGMKVIGLQPIDATPAVVSSTWTLLENTDGHTIEAGTLVSIPDADNNPTPFEVVNDVAVASPSLTTDAGAVLLRSLEEGADLSGLGGTGVQVDIADPITWVDTITLTGLTSGGGDEEDPDAYLDRLSRRMTLATPRPILPGDFELLAIDLAAQDGIVIRASAIDLLKPGTNEKQQILAPTATGGTLKVNVLGGVSGNIAWNASADQVKTALVASGMLSNDDLKVTGTMPAGVEIEFIAAKGQQDIAAMTVNTNSLTPAAPAVSILTSQPGVAADTASERTVTVGAIDATTGQDLLGGTMTSIADGLEALREINFQVFLVPPTRNTVDVTVVGVSDADADAPTVEANVSAAINDYLASVNWGNPPGSEERKWDFTDIVYHQKLSTVINNIVGFNHWTTLTIGLGGGAQTAADHTLSGPMPITQPGVINVTVS